MNTATASRISARQLICTLTACLLSVVLLAEIRQATVQAARHAVLLQA